RSCWVSIRSLTPGMRRRSSPNRCVPCLSQQRINTFHLPPITSSAASTGQLYVRAGGFVLVAILTFSCVSHFVLRTCFRGQLAYHPHSRKPMPLAESLRTTKSFHDRSAP